MTMGWPRGRTLAIVGVVVVSIAMGVLTAAIAAGVFAGDSKGCRPDVEKCPDFTNWHAGLGPGLRVTGILLAIGLLVVATVSYLMKPPQPPSS